MHLFFLFDQVRALFLPPVPRGPHPIRLTAAQYKVALQATEQLTPVQVLAPVSAPTQEKRITSPLRKQPNTGPLSAQERHWFPMTSFRAQTLPLMLVAGSVDHFTDKVHWLPKEAFLDTFTYKEYLEEVGEAVYRRGDYEIAVRSWPGLGADVCVCSGVA